MAFIATTGAMCMCTCGSCPSVFNATPSPCLCNKLPIGSIMDHIPMFNIMPFGICSIMTPPVAASVGVSAVSASPTGYICVPVTPAPWIPVKPNLVTANKKPVLTTDCQLQCFFGGVIKFIVPAEFTSNIK